MKGIGACLAVGLLALGACTQQAAKPAATPAPTVHEWMTGTVAPKGETLSNAVIKAMNDEGKPDASAMTDADWTQVVEAAEALKASAGQMAAAADLKVVAEGAKIQGDGSDGQSTAAQVQGFIDKDRAGFNELAGGLAKISDDFIAAAKAKDAAKLLDASATLDAACQACHSRFWYPEPAPAAP